MKDIKTVPYKSAREQNKTATIKVPEGKIKQPLIKVAVICKTLKRAPLAGGFPERQPSVGLFFLTPTVLSQRDIQRLLRGRCQSSICDLSD